MIGAPDLHDLVSALAQRVRSATSHVSLFPLLSVLEGWVSPAGSVGGDELADRERIHFSHGADFNHPGGEVLDLAIAKEPDGLRVTLKTALLGLLGTESTLPELLSEDVLLHDDEGALAAFFDVFQHRALSLLDRTWRRYARTRPLGAAEDAFSKCLQSFIALDAFSPYDSPRAASPSFTLGLSDLARCEPTYLDTPALEAILRRLFPELSARVVPAEPRPLRAADEDLTLLGEAHCTLGVDMTYGDEALDADGIVRIRIGPVNRALYQELLPGGVRYQALQRLLDELLASRAKAELEILLPASEAPVFTLGEPFGGALGVDTRIPAGEASSLRVRVLLEEDPARAVANYHDDV